MTFVKCIETCYMTYHLIALVEAILSFYIGLVRYGSIGGEIYSLRIIPYSLMVYSR